MLEDIKREILEKDVFTRIKAEEEILYSEWKKKYSSFYAQKTNVKLIIQKLRLKVIDKNSEFVTDTEALRELIERELDEKRIKRIHYKTDFKIASKLYFPYLFKVGKFKGEWIKADISRCFYEVYSRVGIDAKTIAEIDYENMKIELKGVGKGVITKENSEVIKWLESEKMLRNALYGLTRASFYIALYPSGKIERCFFRGRLQNLDLTVIIASFLHAIVKEFEKSILYWNIDGGIIRAGAFEKMKKRLESLGFTLKREAEGEEVEILGLGSYRIGNYETAHYQHGICSHVEEKKYLFEVKGVERIEKWLRRKRW